MTCSRCHRHLPNDSAFCHYCGERLAMSRPTVYQVIPQPISPIVKPPKPKKSRRFCKYCGGVVDTRTKMCTECGKQFFRFTGSMMMSLVLAIGIVLLGAGNIYQYLHYNEETKDLRADIHIQENNVRFLLDEIKEKDDVWLAGKEKSKFMDEYIVFVVDKETKIYHKYGCEDLDLSAFLAFNINMAKGLGYSPCPKCVDE